MGMIAALGNNVEMNCAAARAGIVRSQILPNFKGRSAVDGKEEPIIAHVASLYTRGFEDDVRLVRLAGGALVDLLAHTTPIDWQSCRTKFYLSLPDVDRTTERAAAARHDAATRNLERAQRILSQAASLAHWPAAVEVGFLGISGHAGGLEALQGALEDLQAGRIDTAVLLGVDSLAGERVLDWLQANQRLKCDGTPDGLQPGEAGVAIALSAEQVATERLGGPMTRVLGVHVGEEPRNLLAAVPARGETLSQVVSHAWLETAAPVPWVILDTNGEVHRAMDWGHALARLRATADAFAAPILWYPAISFGDTGAASALTSICVAARAWGRRYAPGDSAIVAAVSDGQARAAVALRHP